MYENLTGVDEEGLAGLTMRRLAGEVGTTPMALYHHVSDKDALLVLMLDDLAREIRRPRGPRGRPPLPTARG
jgi:AcrR family transcriptional regulator